MDEVRFRLLGPMEITLGGVPCILPSVAERALLVQLLLVPGRTLPASLLIDRLWSASTLPVDPANALQGRVSKLRRSLASIGLADVVERQSAGYRANIEPMRVDAVEFEQRVREARSAHAASSARDVHQLHAYDAALGLWLGEPLAEFAAESWAITEAARLSELRLAALTERAQLALELGRASEIIADLEPMVANDPTQESLAGLLMVALYRSGRQADALEVFARTRTHLGDELGLEPSLSLRSAHERILRQDPALLGQPNGDPAPITAPLIRRAVPPTASTLPTVQRALIGRDEQLDELIGLVSTARLVTLVGPGGAGKTSLALGVAARGATAFPNGVWGVRLASVAEPDDVPVAVADALDVPLDGAAADRDLTRRVINFLGEKRLLLLLDNCEHVVDAVAGFVDELLGQCAGVTVLATSREALAVPDEIQFAVLPLPVPPDDVSAEDVLSYPAAQLFVERAAAVRRNTRASEVSELGHVAKIVRALDGIPLAIELAAGRAASLSTKEISERIEQRFALLTSGARTAEARQKTLRATVDWSYALLTPDEQRAFDHLSVFQGGWTLAAAEDVLGETGEPGRVLSIIARLADQSMVVVEDESPTRYRMLETIRQYAVERLASGGEAGRASKRHAAYFRGLVLDFEIDVRGHGQRQALQRLRPEQPNIRAALAWLAGTGGDIDGALEMAGALALFWHMGRHLEGREVLHELLGRADGSALARAKALQAVSIVERPRACIVHPSPVCAQAAEESLATFESAGDAWRAALSKVLLAVEGVTGADRDRWDPVLAEAEEEFRRHDDDWGLGVIGFARMETALKAGDKSQAIALGRIAAQRFRRLDDRWGLSAVLYHLGWGLRQFGDYDEAAPVLEEAIDVAEDAGLFNTVQWALADLGIERAYQGRTSEAAQLFDRAAAASKHVGDGAGEVLAGYGYALLAHLRGDWDEASERYAAAAHGFRQQAVPVSEGLALVGLARAREAIGDMQEARDLYEEARSLGVRLGEPALTASALEGLARAANRDDDPARAKDLRHQAADLRVRSGRPAPPHERQDAATAPATGAT